MSGEIIFPEKSSAPASPASDLHKLYVDDSGNMQLMDDAGDTSQVLYVTGQIPFPATQNASADANTLDDYEEGTWTPVVTVAGGTYTSTTTGLYTRIGRLVSAYCYVTGIATGTPPAAAEISGLPFTGASYASVLICFNTYATSADGGYLGSGGSTVILTNVGAAANFVDNLSSRKFMMAVTYMVS